MTTISLDAAVSGLKAAQAALNTISDNISNVSTPGYTAKILPQETLVVGGAGMGVTLDAVTRSVDQNLLRALWQQTSTSSSASVAQSYLTQIQNFNGSSSDEKSIAAMLGNLESSFSSLSASPDDPLALSQTVNAAQQVAKTFNNFSNLIQQQRQSTETQISQDVAKANLDLQQIAKLNAQIQSMSGGGQSTADLEDQRDQAVKDLSQYIQVSTFKGQNNLLVVQTMQGQALADQQAHQLVFQPNANMTASSSYPGNGLNGLFIDSPTGPEVKQGSIGGEIGGLFTLRDTTLPTYQAQIDELAQKTASRFQQEGLALFTDGNGNVPANVAPPGAVGYVGFAGQIQVNSQVASNPSLLRSGTNGDVVPSGSNEIINKILQYTFGPNAYQQGTGTTDISSGTVFSAAGLTQVNEVDGNENIASYTDLGTAPGITAPAQFTIDAGGGPQTITINSGDTAATLVNNINAALGSNVASLSSGGQLVLRAGADITIGDVSLGAQGIASLGLSFGTTVAQDPSFSVQVGGQSAVTISIASTDTSTDLLAKLNAVPGLSATLNGSGGLVLTPTEGGGLALQNLTGTPLNALGLTVGNVANTAFRQNNLGPGANLSTGLPGTGSITDFATNAMASQAQDASIAGDASTQETNYLNTLTQQNSNTSGVNLDQELANLTRVQSAYNAAAHMLSTSEKMLDDLMNAV